MHSSLKIPHSILVGLRPVWSLILFEADEILMCIQSPVRGGILKIYDSFPISNIEMFYPIIEQSDAFTVYSSFSICVLRKCPNR